MTNAELIAALRCEKDCDDCAYHTDNAWSRCDERGMRCDAADALEVADEKIVELQKQVNEFINNETRSTVIAEEIRNLVTICARILAVNGKVMSRRISELEAQKPKRGEWIEKWRFKTDGTPFHKIGDMECSVCHGDMLGRYYSKYCPHCGALLRGEHDEQ